MKRSFRHHGIAARDAYTFDGTKYGESKTYSNSYYTNVPDIYPRVGTTAAEESKDYYGSPTSATHEHKGTLKVTQTYYLLKASVDSMDDTTFHQLIFGTGSGYWLASRYVSCASSYANFGLRIVSINLYGFDLFASSTGPTQPAQRVRPVVSLGSNVKISSEGGTEDNPREISL